MSVMLRSLLSLVGTTTARSWPPNPAARRTQRGAASAMGQPARDSGSVRWLCPAREHSLDVTSVDVGHPGRRLQRCGRRGANIDESDVALPAAACHEHAARFGESLRSVVVEVPEVRSPSDTVVSSK